MELKQLAYFKCAAEYEHMTKAATRLGVAQPFLSKTIAALEEELGVELFDHVGRGIRLNQNGDFFYKRISEILKSLDSTCDELKKMSHDSGKTVEIASNMGLYISWLLSYFRKQAPDIHITYSTVGRDQLVEMARNKTVDFVLSSPLLEVADLETRLLMNEECPIIYPPGHWLAKADHVRLRDLAGETFVGLKKGYSLREESDRFFAVAGIEPRYAVEVSDHRIMWELVKSGCGLAFSSFTTLITDPVLRENYKVVNDPPCYGTVGLSYRKDKKQDDIFDQFTGMTTQFFKGLKRDSQLSKEGRKLR
ncbi:LysR family transcriptional regulator [Pseudoflavonifractor phocaeensis]|uniref:LysR family transcriptional regulator n=1 Tax=Pseudoflavonifractor phocaeensis TaxID=1870988 RepID=UPI00313C0F2D